MTGQNIKISSLQQRYKLNSRQAVNNRINGLKIDPVARGEISAEQLELLDRLDKHIRGGGAIADFPIQPEVQLDALDKLDKLDNIEFDDNGASAINIMAGLVEKMMVCCLTPRLSPLASYEELEKAIAHRWILPTSLIKELIGVRPKVIKGEKFFIHGSFIIIRVSKIAREAGWRVAKLQTVEPGDIPIGSCPPINLSAIF